MVLCVFVLYVGLVVSEHYLQDHIWGHIIKKHIFRVFFWTLGALLFLHFGLKSWDIDSFIHSHMVWVLLTAAFMGIIPESGPHLIFVMMYAESLIPFSILFTAPIVQDGHGMLPLLSYSIKDSVLIKALIIHPSRFRAIFSQSDNKMIDTILSECIHIMSIFSLNHRGDSIKFRIKDSGSIH